MLNAKGRWSSILRRVFVISKYDRILSWKLRSESVGILLAYIWQRHHLLQCISNLELSKHSFTINCLQLQPKHEFALTFNSVKMSSTLKYGIHCLMRCVQRAGIYVTRNFFAGIQLLAIYGRSDIIDFKKTSRALKVLWATCNIFGIVSASELVVTHWDAQWRHKLPVLTSCTLLTTAVLTIPIQTMSCFPARCLYAFFICLIGSCQKLSLSLMLSWNLWKKTFLHSFAYTP